MTDFLQPITRSWMSKVKKAVEYKEHEFQQDADEAMRFFDGPYDFMYTTKYASRSGTMRLSTEGAPSPTFQMTFNKVAEMVQLFGPVLYHRNPHRQVNPRRYPPFPYELLGDPNDPNVQQQVQMLQMQEQMTSSRERVVAELLEAYLNYTPNELNLQEHMRQMIDEAIIKGMGVVWTEVYRPHGSPVRFVGSFYDSVDNLVVDPDMESFEAAKWIARRRFLPKWEVERRFGLPEDTIRGNLESANMQAEAETAPEYNYYRQRGETNDLFTYWEIYSRMGMGHRMRGALNVAENNELLDRFGPYVYLAVSDEHPWPLNLPEAVWKAGTFDDAFMRVQWPTPFWADPADPWPFTGLTFHRVPRKIWPMSHVKPALGELKFLNWAFSFMADKIKNTSRDFIAILGSLNEEIKTNILSGRDLTLLEIEKHHGTIQQVVQFLQHPQFNGDIYKVVEQMMANLEKRLGLNELMYGETAKQLRSAQEAQVKADQLRVRPDDMASRVEVAATSVARKEAICTRWHLEPQDVAPSLGPVRANLWGEMLGSTDLHKVVHEVEYRIEAGSIRKPNRDRDIANANAAVQVWGPVFQAYAQMTMDFNPLNGLAYVWAKANDMEPELLQMNPPPPPAPDTTDLEMAQAQFEQEMQHRQEAHQLQMRQKMEEAQLKMQSKQVDSAQQAMEKEMTHRQGVSQDQEKHLQDLTQDQRSHIQELTQDQQVHLQDMLQARQEGNLDLFLKRKLGDLDAQIKKKQGDAAVEQTKKMAAAKPKESGNGK